MFMFLRIKSWMNHTLQTDKRETQISCTGIASGYVFLRDGGTHSSYFLSGIFLFQVALTWKLLHSKMHNSSCFDTLLTLCLDTYLFTKCLINISNSGFGERGQVTLTIHLDEINRHNK
jgi:hypothetical protein